MITQKWKFCHNLLTLKLFQTIDGILIDSHNTEKQNMEVNGFGCTHSSNYLHLCPAEEEKIKQVWNHLRESK